MSDYTNCDHTKSNCNKTGKKVKCISSGRTDLIYKKVYEYLVSLFQTKQSYFRGAIDSIGYIHNPYSSVYI